MTTAYVGRRRQGNLVITRRPEDTELIPDHSLELVNHSPSGFEVGYRGSGPAQLACALLLDYYGDEQFAREHYRTNTHTPIDVEFELMSENADKPCCKITRVAQAYHIRDVDAKLLQQREQGASLRELAIFFNKQVLSKALDRATQEVIGDAETIYEVLMDDDTDRARQAELRSKLARYNVDIDDVQQDFISHQTVRNHLDGCREIDTGRESTFDLEAGQKTIEWAQARSEGVIEQTIERLRNAGEVADTQTEVTQSVRVACSACGQSYRIETFLEQGGCDCRPDPD